MPLQPRSCALPHSVVYVAANCSRLLERTVGCCTLHGRCCILHVVHCMSPVVCCMLHCVFCMVHVACCMLQRTALISLSARRRSRCLTLIASVGLRSIRSHAVSDCRPHATSTTQRATCDMQHAPCDTQHATHHLVGLRVKSHGYIGTARAGASLRAICYMRVIVRLCSQQRQQCASAQCALRHPQQTHTRAFDMLLARCCSLGADLLRTPTWAEVDRGRVCAHPKPPTLNSDASDATGGI